MQPLSKEQIQAVKQWIEENKDKFHDWIDELADAFVEDFTPPSPPCDHQNKGNDWGGEYCQKCLVDLPPTTNV